MPRDQVAEQLAEQDWLKPVTAFAESRKADLPACDPVLDTLVKAREWLSDPAHWARYSQLDENGATCALGAIAKFNDGRWGEASRVLDEHVPPMKYACTINFNDRPETTHADVLALFDRAIAARKGA